MKDQLTFEQWLEKYIPNHRSYPCNGHNDPYEVWWHKWINSGHAEAEKAKREEQSREWDRKEKERVLKEKNFRIDAIAKANIPDELQDIVIGIWGESIWKEMLDLIVEKQKSELRNKESKEALRKYIESKQGT